MVKSVVEMKDTFNRRKAYKVIKKLGKLDLEFDFLQKVTVTNNKTLFKPERLYLEGDTVVVLCGLFLLKDFVKTFTLVDID